MQPRQRFTDIKWASRDLKLQQQDDNIHRPFRCFSIELSYIGMETWDMSQFHSFPGYLDS